MSSMNLEQLLAIPEEKRDQAWENKFFQAISQSALELMSEDPQQGPDSWPYLLAKTSDQGSEPFSNLVHWTSQKGVGLAINPDKEFPDYVFSYGMLWSFRETGYFYKEMPANTSTEFSIADASKLISGSPSKEYLPDYVIRILREFFRDQGVHKPRILIVTMDEKNYDLVFSIESLGNPPQKEHAGVAEAISWFLPPHYSIVLASEKDLPPFFDL